MKYIYYFLLVLWFIPASAQKSETAKGTYECSMDCEKGKTYHEQGKCPVCNMDLIASEALHDAQETENGTVKDGHKDHDNHSH